MDHLQAYREMMRVPVRLKENVTKITYDNVLDEKDSKKYLIETSSGTSYLTKDVVICTGSYQTPKAPAVSKKTPL